MLAVSASGSSVGSIFAPVTRSTRGRNMSSTRTSSEDVTGTRHRLHVASAEIAMSPEAQMPMSVRVSTILPRTNAGSAPSISSSGPSRSMVWVAPACSLRSCATLTSKSILGFLSASLDYTSKQGHCP